jgi:uridine kinase
MQSDMTLTEIAGHIESTTGRLAGRRAAVVGVSGIDGSGKGYVSREIQNILESHGLSVANINIDPWLSPPATRFDAGDAGPHFYRHAFDFSRI